MEARQTSKLQYRRPLFDVELYRCPRIFAPPYIFAPRGAKFLGISPPPEGENPRPPFRNFTFSLRFSSSVQNFALPNSCTDNYYMALIVWNQYQFKIVKTELEITTDHRSMIGKELLMIAEKQGFGFQPEKSRESHDCRSPWSGTLGTLFQAL